MTKLLIAALLGAGALALSVSGASADVVCNDEGDCWHVKERHKYPPNVKLRFHPDDWKWADSDSKKYRWRERDGRGYWRNGVWIEF